MNHPSRGLKRRAWSSETMKEMAVAKIKGVFPSRLGKLSDDDWNELGDWLYFETHPKEIDSVKDRRKPTEILKRLT